MVYLLQLVGEDANGVVNLDEELLKVVLSVQAAVGLNAGDAGISGGAASLLGPPANSPLCEGLIEGRKQKGVQMIDLGRPPLYLCLLAGN